MDTKKVLVTGGAGFLGSHLAEFLLNEGHEVVILDDLSGGYENNIPKGANFIKGDIRDKKLVDSIMQDIDIVYHLAAKAAVVQSLFCPIEYAEVDYIGSLNLIVSAVNHKVKRFVFTSSMDRYGKQDKLPMTEDMLPKPEDPYGVSKLMVERILEIYYDLFGMEYVVLVPHNIYGPKQNLADPYRNVIAIFMNRILQGKPPIIYGDGLQTREFSYVDDVTPYIAKAGFASNVVGETINIGPDENPVTIKELADLVIDAMGFDGKPIHAEARPKEVKHAYCSSAKARKLLGYKTATPLSLGLKKMAGWVKKMGPRPFKYRDSFEIESDKIPSTWRKKLL